MANINIKETVRRRIYMAKYSIITKTEKFFIGSLAACSYRIQYPVLDGAPTEINGFFERFAMALAGYAERRYAEMKASGRRLTADEAEIHSLLCEVFENGLFVSIVFTYIKAADVANACAVPQYGIIRRFSRQTRKGSA